MASRDALGRVVLSPSKLHRAEHCPGAFAVPNVPEVCAGFVAIRGQRCHEMLAASVQTSPWTLGLADRAKSGSAFDLEVDRVLPEIFGPSPLWVQAEVGCRIGQIYGTCDLYVCDINGVGHVLDWKTGSIDIVSTQLQTYAAALGAAKVWAVKVDAKRYRIERWHSADADPFARGRALELDGEVEADRVLGPAAWRFKQGQGCTWCDVRRSGLCLLRKDTK